MDLFFFRLVTIHAFDRRTDGQTDGRTEFSSLDRACIPCSAVKTVIHIQCDDGDINEYHTDCSCPVRSIHILCSISSLLSVNVASFDRFSVSSFSHPLSYDYSAETGTQNSTVNDFIVSS